MPGERPLDVPLLFGGELPVRVRQLEQQRRGRDPDVRRRRYDRPPISAAELMT